MRDVPYIDVYGKYISGEKPDLKIRIYRTDDRKEAIARAKAITGKMKLISAWRTRRGVEQEPTWESEFGVEPQGMQVSEHELEYFLAVYPRPLTKHIVSFFTPELVVWYDWTLSDEQMYAQVAKWWNNCGWVLTNSEELYNTRKNPGRGEDE